MAKFFVYCHYEGCMTYEVEAEDEDEAISKAEDKLASETAETLQNNLSDPSFDVEELEKGDND